MLLNIKLMFFNFSGGQLFFSFPPSLFSPNPSHALNL